MLSSAWRPQPNAHWIDAVTEPPPQPPWRPYVRPTLAPENEPNQRSTTNGGCSWKRHPTRAPPPLTLTTRIGKRAVGTGGDREDNTRHP